MEKAQEQGLDATKNDAFNSILAGARGRGLGFSGIPLGEQAQYTASTYLPAVANLKQSFNQQGTSLTDALNSINQNENQYAQTLRQSELDRDQQQAQFEQQLRAQAQQAAQQLAATRAAASSSVASPSFSTGSSQPQSVGNIVQRQGGGFNFTNAKGTAISAGTYAQLNNIPIGNLLYQMAQSGDKYAGQAYNEIKANQAYYNAHPNVLKSEFPSLFWGT